jgi:dienelactone hydrolase
MSASRTTPDPGEHEPPRVPCPRLPGQGTQGTTHLVKFDILRALVFCLTLIATLTSRAPGVFSGELVPDRAGLTPVERRQLWDMTELRKMLLEPEKLSSRRIPAPQGASKAGDLMSTGDPLVPRAERAPGGSPDGIVVEEAPMLVEEYYYSSEMTSQGPNRIYCAVARPDGIKGRVPVILIFHGGGGHASPALALAAARRHPGMAGFAMDYNGQFAPGTGSVTRWKNVTRERRLDLSPDLRNHPMYHHVIAARRGIDFLETQPWADTSRIGCVGISAGGWLALILAGVDGRVRAVTTGVSAGGAEGTAGRSAQTLRWEPAEQRPLWLSAYEPLAYAADTRAAVFFQLATNDIFFWLSGAERNLASLRGKKGWLLRPNSNHGIGGPELPDTSPPAWMRSILNDEQPLPEVRQFQAGPDRSTYTWKVEGPGPVSRTVLNWSPGKTVSPARYWVEFPAERTGDLWTARLPQAFAALSSAAFVTVFDPRRGAVSSTVLHRDGIDPCTTPGPLWNDGAFWDVARGSAAWRSPAGWLAPTQFEAVVPCGLRVGPAGESREFALLSNSVVLSSGVASQYLGLRLRIDGNNQAGALSVSLLRNSGSMDEVASRAVIDFSAGSATYELPWVNFKSDGSEAAQPWPFDGLLLGGRREGGSPLKIEAIELFR